MVVIKDGKSHGMSILGSHPTLFPPYFCSPASVPWDTLPASMPALSRTFPSLSPVTSSACGAGGSVSWGTGWPGGGSRRYQWLHAAALLWQCGAVLWVFLSD